MEPAKELERLRNYFSVNGQTLLSDYLAEEHERQEHILFANDHFCALVPNWTMWPFESIVIAHRNGTYLDELTPAEVSALADIMKRLTTRYDNLFEISFPYSRVSTILNARCTPISIRCYCCGQRQSENS